MLSTLSKEWTAHGEQIVPTLSAQLALEFGEGFDTHNFFRPIRFVVRQPEQAPLAFIPRSLP
jgi:hypothetical protein